MIAEIGEGPGGTTPHRRPSPSGAALAYAARGWPVCPVHSIGTEGLCTCGKPDCSSPAKHPRTARGILDATTDAAAVLHLWRRWPSSNVAVATGQRSGLLVIDVDPSHGGQAALAALELKFGRLPAGPETSTGGGGRHLLLRYPSDVRVPNSAGLLGCGLDVRGEGGYIVAPPSIHVSARHYQWKLGCWPDDIPLAQPPGWLLSLLTRKAGCLHTIPETDASSIPEGRRNATLTRLAGGMRRQGATRPSILAALREQNRVCSPPLGDAELQSIAASVSRYRPASTEGSRNRRPSMRR